MRSPGYALTCFILATLSLSCSLVDLRRSTDTDCTSQPAEFCTRLNDSQPPADACQSWTCNKATRFCDLGPRDLDADGAIDPECAPSGGTHPLDCDDTNANRFPDNPEVCDFIDNNCDNLTDENVYTVFDELTDDPNSFIPDACPAGIDCSDDQAVVTALAYASRPSASDPQVMATFIRPVGPANRGLLGAALFDAAEWRFLSIEDLVPYYQPNDTQPITFYDDFNASAIVIAPLNAHFAFAATGLPLPDGTSRVLVDGIIHFEAPPGAWVRASTADDELDNINASDKYASLPAISATVGRVLSAYVRSEDCQNHHDFNPDCEVVVVQLAHIDQNNPLAGCEGNTPCLESQPVSGTSSIVGDVNASQPPAVLGIDDFGWLVAIVDNDSAGRLVIHRVQANESATLDISQSLLDQTLSEQALSNVVLTQGPQQGTSHQFALAYVSNGHAVAHLFVLDSLASPPTLSMAHTLDLSVIPGMVHGLPQIVWHPLRKQWIVAILDTPARLFAVRFTQDGVLVDSEAVPVFEARNLQPGIGFHVKPIETGFAILGYQLAGEQGNLIASKFGCTS